MKKKIKSIGLMLGIMILLSIIIPLLPVGIFTQPVNATVGYTSVNITGTVYTLTYSGVPLDWATLNSEPTANYQETYDAGWLSYTNYNFIQCSRCYVKWDLSALSPGVQVTSMKIWTLLNITPPSSTTHWLDDYYAPVNMQVVGTTPTYSEWSWPETHRQLLCGSKRWTTFTTGSSWYSWPVISSAIPNILAKDSGNLTWAAFESLDDFYNVGVTWYNSEEHYLSLSSMELEVTYADPPAPRTMNKLSNAADYTGILYGTENVTAVSWLTPRAAYADETIGLRIEGNPGASFNYQLLSAHGDLITSGNQTIKTNGYYYKYTTVPVTFNDWIRMTVTDSHNNVVYSYYGRVELPPNTTEQNLTVSATDTAYPQYDNDFSTYMIYKNGIGKVYWKTNLVLGDMNDYSLKFLAGGDEANATSWNATMTWLNTYYYQTVDPVNNAMAHWRYIMFSPFVSNTGFNSYDGMIIDMSQDYTISQTGFWQGTIRKNSDNSTLTWTDSAYFYLNDISQGVSITLDSSSVTAGDQMKATVVIGDHSKVGTRLRNLTVIMIDSTGLVVGTGTGFVSVGSTPITFTAPSVNGEYQVRFNFSDTTLVPDYAYIHDLPFTVSTSSGAPGTPGQTGTSLTDWTSWFKSLIKKYNMDTEGGHWLIIFILCAIWVVLLWKHTTSMTAMICLTIGGALVLNWLNPWFYVLLILGAAITITGIFKKKTHTEDES